MTFEEILPGLKAKKKGEGFSMWSPTPCDVLATDWVEVHD